MADEPYQIDPLLVIAALLEVAGGEVTVPQAYLEGKGLSGEAIELEDRRETDGTIKFRLAEKQEAK